MYLVKPADLTHIDYIPLQHLLGSLEDYMKIMKKRFDVMKKVALDKRTHDQYVQQTKANQDFP